MFKLNRNGDILYYTVPSFEATGVVRHLISTRFGGVSGGCYSSMNLRFNCDDSRDNVLENFKRLAKAAGTDYHNIVLSRQVHEDIIVKADRSHFGNGILYENKFDSADGLITDLPGISLVTLYADCTPILFLDPNRRVIASVHSGWRGTVKRIGAKTVQKMINDYGSHPEDILCAIGPSIRVECFEVGDEVAQAFIKSFGEDTVKKQGEKYHADMQLAIKKQLTDEGILPQNIDDCGICTFCNSDEFFSHRKTNGRRGNFAALIELVG